jgi:hypothetical protein
MEVAMEKVEVCTTFRPDQPIEVWPDEAESLRQQGLLCDPPAVTPPAATAARPAAKQEPAAK